VKRAMLNPEQHTITGVPFDNRLSAFSDFEAHMERRGLPERVHLLCSAAYKGSGKTTLLHINMQWFVNATQGIAIHVTFNDDQSHSSTMWKGHVIETDLDFERAVAVRMLHRLVENSESSNYLNDREGIDAILSDVVDSFSNAIPQTLELVRRVLGVPESTKVMLAVDEISKAPKDITVLTPKIILGALARQMDRDVTVFLAVAANLAVDVQTFYADSHRSILLQCLPPLYFTQGFDTNRMELLPEAIRPFFRKEERKWLPVRKEDMVLYDRLSKLILATGGHPRRVMMLFTALHHFHQSNTNHSYQEINGRPAGLHFVESLRTWLNHKREMDILESMEIGADFPTDFNLGQDVSAAIEQIAVDTSKAFGMPGSSRAAEIHKYTFLGTTTGHCSILDCVSSIKLCAFLAFIPPPVLAVIKKGNVPDELRPCGRALLQLADAMKIFHQPPQNETDLGKAWAQVLAAALLLYTRSNDGFSPSIFCSKELCGEEISLTELYGGETVEFWEDVDASPKDEKSPPMDRKVTADELRELIDRIPKTSSGALFIPKYRHNVKCNDVVGIFKTVKRNYVVLCIQAKDWMKDEDQTQEGGTMNSNAEWRQRETFPAPMQILDKNQNREVTVTPFHLLLTTNELTIETREVNKSKAVPPLHAREGRGSIREMVNWLPTAGYACQLGVKLREAFAPVQVFVEEGSSDPDPN